MNREQFIQFVKSPAMLDAESTTLLEKLVREYPYCQTAEILYALNLNKENNFRFNTQLKMAAAYAPDRRVLKYLLQGQKDLVARDDGEVEKSDSSAQAREVHGHDITTTGEHPDAREPAPEEEETDIEKRKAHLIQLIDQLKNEVETILKEKRDPTAGPLIDLVSRLEDIFEEHEHPDRRIKPDIKDYNFAHLPDLRGGDSNTLSNEDLIDKFIEEEPRIEAPRKAEFFDAVDYARHGLEDKQDIVSETLARVHLKQGYPDRAIKIYERLSLLYPEKSSYFAAQIEKIRGDQLADL